MELEVKSGQLVCDGREDKKWVPATDLIPREAHLKSLVVLHTVCASVNLRLPCTNIMMLYHDIHIVHCNLYICIEG